MTTVIITIPLYVKKEGKCDDDNTDYMTGKDIPMNKSKDIMSILPSLLMENDVKSIFAKDFPAISGDGFHVTIDITKMGTGMRSDDNTLELWIDVACYAKSVLLESSFIVTYADESMPISEAVDHWFTLIINEVFNNNIEVTDQITVYM